MRSKTLIMIGIAIVFGLAGVLMAQKWLDRQSSRLREAQVAPKPAAAKIVVVAAPLRFGTELSPQHLREVPWPEGAIPKGAFGSVKEILDGPKRVALMAMEENEPVLKTKITGPGQRASLAAIIDPGMKALTVRVNDVNGVAGFVLPGERVDVLLTRQTEKESFADVLLQNVKVLAADQSADERSEKPSVVKAVTLEVSTAQAQKLTLASSVGSLSLTLRAAGMTDIEATRRVSLADLAQAEAKAPAPAVAEAPVAAARVTTTVSVARAMRRQEYSVPVQPHEASESPAAKVSQAF